MRDSGSTRPPLSSEAVDAQFWALICDDAEWLLTEFDGIVSEPAEHPITPHLRTWVAVDRQRHNAFGRPIRTSPTRRRAAQPRPSRPRGHERSPPALGM